MSAGRNLGWQYVPRVGPSLSCSLLTIYLLLLHCAEGGSEGGWGDDGLGTEAGLGGGSEGGEGGWEMEDLEIPADVAAEAAVAETSSMFVAPTAGASAANVWQTKCSLVAEQVAAGAFDTAMRLLTR